MAQSTLRRFSAVAAFATTIVFICTLGYMVTMHTDLCRYEHMGELDRRAVAVASVLDVLPSPGVVTQLASLLSSEGSTSNDITVSITGTSTPVPIGSSSTFPYTTTVQAIAGNVTLTERTNIEPNYSCAPLAAGQGLCVLLCYLAIQIGFVQFGNLLASRGQRIAGLVSCAVAFISGIAFITGMVVLVGTTQRECALYARAEDMESTLALQMDAVGHLIDIDPQSVTNAKLQISFVAASTAMGDEINIAWRSSTFPSTSPYYGLLGQGTMPSEPYVTLRDSSRGVDFAATYRYSDKVGNIVYYTSELPSANYILDVEYVSYALTLGLVPYVVVMVAALVVLPYPSLGALESGAAGVFPWQWRMSRGAGLVKWAHMALIAFLVIGMCTVGLCAGFGNRAVYNGLVGMIQMFKTIADRSSTIANAFLDTLVLIANRQYTDDTSLPLPSGAATADEVALLTAWYTALMGRLGTMVYNSSSLFFEIRAAGTTPSLLNMTTFVTLMASLTPAASTTVLEYATYMDFSFLVFARNSNYTDFNAKMSATHSILRPIANESSAQLAAFDAAWASYTTDVATYTDIATSFKAQIYTTKDIRDFYATAQGLNASAVENAVLGRASANSDLPPFTYRVSAKYAAYQIKAALGTVLPAIILLSLLAVGDAICTHYVFGLGQKWVPSNDPTSVNPKIRVDHARLGKNLRHIIAATTLACVVLVVLSSIFYAQAVEDAKLRYAEDADALKVTVALKRLLTAQTEFSATSFVWTRGTLSRSDADLSLAVEKVLGWQDYLAELPSTWVGPTTSALRSLLVSANAALSKVMQEAVLVCGIRVINIVYAYDQLSELLTKVVATPLITVPALVTCYGDADATSVLQLLLSVYQQLLAKTLTASSAAQIAAQLTTIRNTNPSCSITAELDEIVTYLPAVNGLQVKDDRISVPEVGLMLQRSASTATSTLLPFTNYAPISNQMSSQYAVFWMPVLLCWLLLPLMHVLWTTTTDTVRALQ